MGTYLGGYHGVPYVPTKPHGHFTRKGLVQSLHLFVGLNHEHSAWDGCLMSFRLLLLYGTVSFSLRLITLISKVPKLQYAIYRVFCVSIPKGLHVAHGDGVPCQGCIRTTEEETFLEWGRSAGRNDLGLGAGEHHEEFKADCNRSP